MYSLHRFGYNCCLHLWRKSLLFGHEREAVGHPKTLVPICRHSARSPCVRYEVGSRNLAALILEHGTSCEERRQFHHVTALLAVKPSVIPVTTGTAVPPRAGLDTLDKRQLDLYCSPNIVRVIKWRGMRWAGHVARMGEERVCIGSWWGNRREEAHWGDLGVDGWIILGWISRRWDVGIWTGLGWARIETGGGRLWVR